MPLYRNPDFRRLPPGLASVFARDTADSFFALPAWYDLVARCGVPSGTQIRAYTDERQASATAILVQTSSARVEHRLASLANAHSIEHGIIRAPGADLDAGLTAILSQILGEQPQWDCLRLTELDPRDPSYRALVGALRRARLLVECSFNSGTWYEDTAALTFADYVAARPSALRNTWRRKRRKLERSNSLTKSFFRDPSGIDQAIADYQTIYDQSWKPAELFPNFIPALIGLASEVGALRLGIYYIDGNPAAAQLWIVWSRRAVICKLAHAKRFDNLSLGTLLTMEMIERVLAEDRPREISLGRGDDPYKRLWLSKRRERWGVTAANPRTVHGLALGLRRQAAMIYHRLRGERVSPFG